MASPYDRLKRGITILWALLWRYGLRAVLGVVRPTRPGLRILLYHRVSPNPSGGLAVSPGTFDRQIASILASGRRIVPLGQVPAILGGQVLSGEGDRTPSGKLDQLVVLTFDDGYRDNLTQALPILKRHGVPAAVFVPVSLAGSGEAFPWMAGLGVDPADDEDSQPLSWDEIRRLAEGGVEIQSHGLGHDDLTSLPPSAVEAELGLSADVITRETGRAPTAFAYPYGRHSPGLATAVARAGYPVACTCCPGVNNCSTPLHLLRRTMVEATDTPAVFQARLEGAFDRPFPYGLKNLVKRLLGGRESGPSLGPRAGGVNS